MTVIVSSVVFPAGIVKCPASVIVTPAVAEVLSTDHVTALFANPVVTTVADKSIEHPAEIVAVLGDTVTELTACAVCVNTTAFSNGELSTTAQI